MVHCRTSTNNPACDHWSDNLNPPFLFIVCTTLIFRKKLLSTINVINPATKSCADLMTGIVWQVWTSGEPSGTRYIVWCVCFAAAIWFSFHMYYTLALSHLITCKVSLLREMRSLEIAFKLDRWPSVYELNMKVSKMNLSRTYIQSQERRVTSTCGLGLPPCSLTMDTTPTGLFDSYELDFKHIIRSISDKLEGNGKNQLGGMCIVTYYLHVSQPHPFVWQEQRKAALRKVELELDEADDIVHISPFFQCATESHCFFLRYLNWKLRFRSFRSRLNLLTRLV